MRRFLNIALRLILIPVIFLGIIGLCGTLASETEIRLTAYMQSGEGLTLTYYDGKYTTVDPVSADEDAGGLWFVTFRAPKNADGIYTFGFGKDNTAVRISDVSLSEGIFRRSAGSAEIAVRFTKTENVDTFSVNSVNETFMFNSAEGGASLTNVSPLEGRYVPLTALAVIGAISVVLSLVIAPMIMVKKDRLKPPFRLALRVVGGCVAAVFVVFALIGGIPNIKTDNSSFDEAAKAEYRTLSSSQAGELSLKEQMEKLEAERAEQDRVETEAEQKQDAVENVYDDSIVYPMMIGSSGKRTDEQNKPKVTEEQLTQEGFEYDNVHVGKTDENGTTWYFYNDEKSEFNGYNLASSRDLDRMVKSFTAYAEQLEQLGIEFYIVICPNKSTVYPEYVPSNSDWYQSTYTKLDQVYETLAAETDLNVIDLREALLEAKETDFPLYYEYDTHWNNYGGFAAYTEIMKVISEKFPDVRIRQRDDYQINLMESYMKDQLWYLGYYNKFDSIGPVFTPLVPSGTKLVDITPNKIAGIFQYQYVYPDGFMDWNKFSKFINPPLEDAGAPSAYVLRDSFGISLTYFMRESFGKTVFSLTNGGLPSIREIQKEEPDILIYEIAERNLNAMFAQ